MTTSIILNTRLDCNGWKIQSEFDFHNIITSQYYQASTESKLESKRTRLI